MLDGGRDKDHNLYELDMLTLTWTKRMFFGLHPGNSTTHLLTAISDDKLILHRGSWPDINRESYETLVIDLPTMTVSKKRKKQNPPSRLRGQTMTAIGENSTIIFGGESHANDSITVMSRELQCIRLDKVKSLQSICKRDVYKHRRMLQPHIHLMSIRFRECPVEGEDAIIRLMYDFEKSYN